MEIASIEGGALHGSPFLEDRAKSMALAAQDGSLQDGAFSNPPVVIVGVFGFI
jgi:hypothetical protein